MLPVLTITNKAAMKIGVHVSSRIMVFSGYIPRSGIAGSYGSSILSNLFFKEVKFSQTPENACTGQFEKN